MGKRGGYADLPLHGGRVQPWLAQRMARLGRPIVEALVLHYGRDEVLSRLSHPFWFQSFGAVMSSGLVEPERVVRGRQLKSARFAQKCLLVR